MYFPAERRVRPILLTKFRKSRFTRGQALSPLKIVNSCVEHLAKRLPTIPRPHTLASVVGPALCSFGSRSFTMSSICLFTWTTGQCADRILQAPRLSQHRHHAQDVVCWTSKAWRPPPLRVSPPNRPGNNLCNSRPCSRTSSKSKSVHVCCVHSLQREVPRQGCLSSRT